MCVCVCGGGGGCCTKVKEKVKTKVREKIKVNVKVKVGEKAKVKVDRIFVKARNCAFYAKKIIWDAKLKCCASLGRKRSEEDTYHYHIRSIWVPLGLLNKETRGPYDAF